MWTLISRLLIINGIMTLIHESGFISYVDDWISKRWKFYHLPYPIRCLLCGTFWLSLLFVVITGQIHLWTILACLINAHMTKVTQPLYRMIENILLKAIMLLNKGLGL